MDESLNTLSFTDQELNILNDIIRQHKVTLTNEELTLLVTGKRSTPLAELTLKIAIAWEQRAAALQNPGQQAAEPAPAKNTKTKKE